jgi:uncharacterized protein YggE
MNTKVPALLGLGLLVVLAGCMGGAQPLNTAALSNTDGGPEGPTISVSSSGTVDAAPDLAVVYLAVEAQADTAEEARAQVARDATRMRDALREAGISDDAVTTTGFAVYIEYDYSDRGREVIGYRAVHSYRVEVAPEDAGTVIDTAVKNGATRVSGVQFTLSDERRQELRAQALEEAMTSARSDADAIAGASGLTVSGVHSVTTANGGGGPIVYTDRAAAEGSDATVLEPGDVTVTASVSVVYTAE